MSNVIICIKKYFWLPTLAERNRYSNRFYVSKWNALQVEKAWLQPFKLLFLAVINFQFTDICLQFYFLFAFFPPVSTFNHVLIFLIRSVSFRSFCSRAPSFYWKWFLPSAVLRIPHRWKHVSFVYKGNLEARIAAEKQYSTINKKDLRAI